MSKPRTEYERRLELRRARHQELDRRERALSNIRLVIFLVGVALGVVALVTDGLNPM